MNIKDIKFNITSESLQNPLDDACWRVTYMRDGVAFPNWNFLTTLSLRELFVFVVEAGEMFGATSAIVEYY